MVKICIIGSTGLLGQALVKECRGRNYETVGVARTNADICLDVTDDNALTLFLRKEKFDIVINTVAIVNHKACDDSPEKAYLINARPSSILAKLSSELEFKYVYISTDGYFTDDKNKKHDETSKVQLLNEYARTKYIGECFTLLLKDSLVVRTNIVGFRNDNIPTFFEWVLNSLENKDEMVLFDDYYTSSISVKQFSKALLDLLRNNACGLYNLASSEVFSKKKFIEKTAEIFNFELTNTKIGSVNQLNSKRANSLGLDVKKAEKLLGYKLPSLTEVIYQLKAEQDEQQTRNLY